MTGYAIFLEVSRHLLIGCVGFVKRPSPSIAPQGVIWKAVFFILDHDEPHYRSRSPTRITCRHLSVMRLECLFHHHRAIRELSIFAVILSRARRGVSDVHLIPRRIDPPPCSKLLVLVSIVGRLTNVPGFVGQFKAVEGRGLWGRGFLGVDEQASQEDERKSEKRNADHRNPPISTDVLAHSPGCLLSRAVHSWRENRITVALSAQARNHRPQVCTVGHP